MHVIKAVDKAEIIKGLQLLRVLPLRKALKLYSGTGGKGLYPQDPIYLKS